MTGCLTPNVLMVQWFGFPDSHLTLPCMLWHIWPRKKNKTATQVHCPSFWGEQLWKLFFLKLGRKNGNNMFFVFFWVGMFLKPDIFWVVDFPNEITWISTFIWEIRHSDVSTNNKKLYVFHLNLSNCNQLCNVLLVPQNLKIQQNKLIASEMILALINMYGSNMIISFFRRVFHSQWQVLGGSSQLVSS